MKFSIRKRIAALSAATAVVIGGMAVGASTASADSSADRLKFVYAAPLQAYNVYINGRIAGRTGWQANGDTLLAQDLLRDGYWIEAYLGTSPVRKASTAGHDGVYTKKVGGNVPENRKYTYWVCVAKRGSSLRCSDIHKVKS